MAKAFWELKDKRSNENATQVLGLFSIYQKRSNFYLKRFFVNQPQSRFQIHPSLHLCDQSFTVLPITYEPAFLILNFKFNLNLILNFSSKRSTFGRPLCVTRVYTHWKMESSHLCLFETFGHTLTWVNVVEHGKLRVDVG